VCRGLRLLEQEGLVAALPRKGYRVLSRVNDPAKGCPLAFVLSEERMPGLAEHFGRALRSALERAAKARGSSVVTLAAGTEQPDSLAEHLRAMRAWGAVVDTPPDRQGGSLGALGIPIILVDDWAPDLGIDSVVQDDFGGGELAVRHLLESKHKRIGWFGPVEASSHSRARFSGAAGALARAGLAFSHVSEVDLASPRLIDEARKFLSRKGRPTAVLALWLPVIAALCAAAHDVGLAVGDDFDAVGWCAEEIYDTTFREAVSGGALPACVVWSVTRMAETAVSRLIERRLQPALPPVRINIEAHLKLADEAAAGRTGHG